MADKRKPAALDSVLARKIKQWEREAQRKGTHGDLTGAGRYEAMRVTPNGPATIDDAMAAFIRGMEMKRDALMKAQRSAQYDSNVDEMEYMRGRNALMAAKGRQDTAQTMDELRSPSSMLNSLPGRASIGERDARYWDAAARGEHIENPQVPVTDEELKNAALTTASIASLPLMFAAPVAAGTGLLARGLTGAAMGKASDYPIEHLMERAFGPGEEMNPYLGATIGGALGMATAPASVKAIGRGADALMTMGARGVENVNDALNIVPYRSFMPNESASWAFPASQNFSGKPVSGRSHKAFLTGDMHQQAMLGEQGSPYSLRGQGSYWNNDGKFEANDLFVTDMTGVRGMDGREAVGPEGGLTKMAQRLNSRLRQEAIAPYVVRPALTERGANATMFERPSRQMIIDLGRDLGNDAVIADNPFLDRLVVSGFENDRAKPEVLEEIVRRLGSSGEPAVRYGNYVTGKSAGIPRIAQWDAPGWLR